MRLVKFKYKAGYIRVYLDDYGDPWWVLTDIRYVLSLSKGTSSAADCIHNNEKCKISVPTYTGVHEVWAVSETGLLKLLGRCRRLEAEHLAKWVNDEIMLEIRSMRRLFYDPKSLDVCKGVIVSWL